MICAGLELRRVALLLALTVAFIVVYLGIALEHPIRIDKAASALFGAGLFGPSMPSPQMTPKPSSIN